MRRVAIDIETTVRNDVRASPYTDDLICITINDGVRSWLTYDPHEEEPILADPTVLKIFHGGVFDLQFLLHYINQDRIYDLRVQNVWDTLLIERVLTAGTNAHCDLGSVAEKYSGVFLDKNIRDSFRLHSGELNQVQIDYALEDVNHLLTIQAQQEVAITSRNMLETVQLENELMPIVADMELEGIGFNPDAWAYILEVETSVLPKIEADIQSLLSPSFSYDIFTGKFTGMVNLNSSVQLKLALKRLGIPVEDTQSSTLEKVTHPIGQQILEYREHAKRLQWDYPKYINPITGRIHPSIVQVGADTGRFSCKNPNLQNVPHDQLFRDMFVAKPGYMFVIADYAQQELRVLAEHCHDENLLKACRFADPHLENARIIYSDPSIQKQDARRTVAKGCSFALVYGASPETLGHSAGLGLKEAKRVHKKLHTKYPGVDKWGTESWNFLKSHGYIVTLGGRRRYFPKVLEDPGKYMTVARNTPIQGTSADMMKRAMILISGYIAHLNAKLLLCIHDEIIVECTKDVSSEVAQLVERGMVEAGEYYVKSVPIIAETQVSSVWKN